MEHVGPVRSWQPDEEAFVSTAAALVAQVLSHSERVRAEEAFRESESRYGILVNTMKDVLYSLTTDGQVEFVGPQVQAYGYSEAEMMGKDFLPFIYAEDQPAVLRDFQHTATTGEETLSTFRFLDRNGRLRWFEEIGRAVRDRAGNIVAVSGIMRDITERKQAKERIRQQAALLDASHDLNNILSPLVMGVELLGMQSPD